MSDSIYVNSHKTSNVRFVDNIENTILCNKVREDFLGLSTLFLGSEEIICEHTDSSTVYCDITIDDKKFLSVPFKLIIEDKEQPVIILNKNTLNNPKQILA